MIPSRDTEWKPSFPRWSPTRWRKSQPTISPYMIHNPASKPTMPRIRIPGYLWPRCPSRPATSGSPAMANPCRPMWLIHTPPNTPNTPHLPPRLHNTFCSTWSWALGPSSRTCRNKLPSKCLCCTECQTPCTIPHTSWHSPIISCSSTSSIYSGQIQPM